MEVKTRDAKIIIIGGRARSGKDTITNYMLEYYSSKGVKAVSLAFGSYLKEYAKKISNWDGLDETKPRKLLQELGTDIIRGKIDDNFFINRIIEDIKVYSYFFDIIIISDARLKKEIDMVKSKFKNVKSICVKREDNTLSENEKKHLTEIDLEDYDKFDYIIDNNGSKSELNKKIIELLGEDKL